MNVTDFLLARSILDLPLVVLVHCTCSSQALLNIVRLQLECMVQKEVAHR